MNFGVLESKILHTSFQDNQRNGPGEDCFKVFTIYGHGGHPGHVAWTKYFVPLSC